MTATTYQRALPGTDGALHADAPAVEAAIDGETFNVTLDVAGQVDLETLAKTIHADAHARWCWMVLARNSSTVALRIRAANDLRAIPAVRAALTVTLGPSQADELANELDVKSTEPARCARGCGNYAVTREEDDDVCAGCVQPDEYDEFERRRDH